MRVIPTALHEVKIIEPHVIGDERGFFYESWNARDFAAAGMDGRFVQDNHSRSAKGVLRGLHYQLHQPQGKIVRAVAGAIFDVAVDLRRSSASFGRWAGVELSAANRRMMWVPPGFAHGFLTLEEGSEVLYKCTDLYAPEHERCLLWSDETLGVSWPLGDIGFPTLSARDAAGTPLSVAETFP